MSTSVKCGSAMSGSLVSTKLSLSPRSSMQLTEDTQKGNDAAAIFFPATSIVDSVAKSLASTTTTEIKRLIAVDTEAKVVPSLGAQPRDFTEQPS